MSSRRTLAMPESLIEKVQNISEVHNQEGPLDFDLRLKIKK